MTVGPLKTMLRGAILPARQVPVNFLFGRLRGTLEPELALLPALVGRRQRAIDLGGNRGTHAYRLAGLGTQVEVCEPTRCACNCSSNGRRDVRTTISPQWHYLITPGRRRCSSRSMPWASSTMRWHRSDFLLLGWRSIQSSPWRCMTVLRSPVSSRSRYLSKGKRSQ